MKTLTILSLWYIYLATLWGDLSLDTDPILIESVGLPSTKSHRCPLKMNHQELKLQDTRGSTHSEVPNLLKAPGQG